MTFIFTFYELRSGGKALNQLCAVNTSEDIFSRLLNSYLTIKFLYCFKYCFLASILLSQTQNIKYGYFKGTEQLKVIWLVRN